MLKVHRIPELEKVPLIPNDKSVNSPFNMILIYPALHIIQITLKVHTDVVKFWFSSYGISRKFFHISKIYILRNIWVRIEIKDMLSFNHHKYQSLSTAVMFILIGLELDKAFDNRYS